MKRWKRWEFLFCFVVLWGAALFQAYGLYQENREEEKTVEAFEALEVSDVEGWVEISATIPEKTEKKEQFLTEIIREMELDSKPTFEIEEKNGREEIFFKKEKEKECIKISYYTQGEQEYVVAVYEGRKEIGMLLQYKTKLERWFRMREMEYTTNLNLKGSKSGKMTTREKEEVTDRLFHSLNAVEIEAVREADLYTIYGYSPVFGNSITYGENEINLNLAFTYNEEEEKTQFYLAMPYIQADY